MDQDKREFGDTCILVKFNSESDMFVIDPEKQFLSVHFSRTNDEGVGYSSSRSAKVFYTLRVSAL